MIGAEGSIRRGGEGDQGQHVSVGEEADREDPTVEGGGWDLRRLDATDAFKAVVATTSSDEDDGKRWSKIWERQVVEPSAKVVKRFLEE